MNDFALVEAVGVEFISVSLINVYLLTFESYYF